MRHDVTAKWCVAGLMALGLLWPGVALAADPTIDVPPDRVSGGLNDADRAQIKTYVEFFWKKLVEAPTSKAASDARRKLAAEYNHYASPFYRGDFANLSGAEAVKAMAAISKAAPGPLRTSKEVIAAAAVGDMSHARTLPVLLQLAGHANPAVRYVAWEGLAKKELQRSVFAQPADRDRLYGAIQQALTGEKNLRVLAAVLAGANIEAIAGGEDNAGVVWAQVKLVPLHKAAAMRLYGQALGGDPDAVDALRIGQVSLKSVAKDANANLRQEILQLALNAAYVGSIAIDPDEPTFPYVSGRLQIGETRQPPVVGKKSDDKKTEEAAPEAAPEPAKPLSLTLPGSTRVKEVAPGIYTFKVAAGDYAAFKAAVDAEATLKLLPEKPCINEAIGLLREADAAFNLAASADNQDIKRALNNRDAKARAAAVKKAVAALIQAAIQQFKLTDPATILSRPTAEKPASAPADVTVDLRPA